MISTKKMTLFSDVMSSLFPVMLNLKLNNIQTSGQTGPKVSVTKLHNLNCDFMQHMAETEAT